MYVCIYSLGYSVSLSLDGRVVVVGSRANDDNGEG
jgi:hypothetical protein